MFWGTIPTLASTKLGRPQNNSGTMIWKQNLPDTKKNTKKIDNKYYNKQSLIRNTCSPNSSTNDVTVWLLQEKLLFISLQWFHNFSKIRTNSEQIIFKILSLFSNETLSMKGKHTIFLIIWYKALCLSQRKEHFIHYYKK